MAVSWSGQALMIVPTYNERENLARLVAALRGLPGDVHVLVVDDNSPDGTGQIALELAARDPGVFVLQREGKLGLGTAYKAGFAFGLARGYQYLCTMDADFSHHPASVPALLEKAASGYDLVVGSRYVPGGRIVGTTPWRQFVSYSANWLAHVLLGVTVRDCTAGFRCYRRRVLETIDLDAIFSSGYSFLIEMAFHCQQAGFRIGEVPITFVNRTEGASKISKREIYKAFYTLLRLRTSMLPWERMVALYQRHRARRLPMEDR
ncbi:polyprenol monophosphomannose synthase [Litorilinea aerophila]|uniref:Polyprenol monophosphomannose synthase n=1 Tax=Litorilinea aerophila TaxID=1204385 RepID=A0A540VHL6_9CHLR|nr:polyprenol monophosphomannose synthase [Litorilinea aerophila]MCC9076231.1 polyprenol monophosphomannose synthase [Litorilinea aerophila]GIV79977.1 MAG: dolichyl-phosphate beta-D-mannosyltransferase [Litorilinea sp.]